MIITPTVPLPEKLPHHSLFLGGTIDQGNSENWQARCIPKIKAQRPATWIFNPRRETWDPAWNQDPENAQLKSQINWELDAQSRVSLCAYYFSEFSQSPITLLELGLFHAKTVGVFCTKKYSRFANVVITCNRLGIPVFHDEDRWVQEIIRRLSRVD